MKSIRHYNMSLLLVVNQSLVKLFDRFAHHNFTPKMRRGSDEYLMALSCRSSLVARYYDGVDPNSVPLSDDNDPFMSDRTTIFEKPITDQ